MIDKNTQIYVIYKNGTKLNNHSYRAEYNSLKSAKSTITRLSKNDAINTYEKSNTTYSYWDELSKEQQVELHAIKKDNYEIRIFIDSGIIV